MWYVVRFGYLDYRLFTREEWNEGGVDNRNPRIRAACVDLESAQAAMRLLSGG